MSEFDAVMIAEGVQEEEEHVVIKAWQKLIDTGLAWKLQGIFGRTAQILIDAGICNACQ